MAPTGKCLFVLNLSAECSLNNGSRYIKELLLQHHNFYLNKLLPAFSSLASKTPEAYSYLSESILAWPNQHELKLNIEKAGYTDVSFRNLTFGIVAVHSGIKG